MKLSFLTKTLLATLVISSTFHCVTAYSLAGTIATYYDPTGKNAPPTVNPNLLKVYDAYGNEVFTEEKIIYNTGDDMGDGTTYLSLQDAIDKSIKENYNLYMMDLQKDYLKEQRIDLWNYEYIFAVPSSDISSKEWVIPIEYSYAKAMLNLESAMEQINLQKENIEIALELSMKNTFSTIIQAESNLKLVKASRDLEEYNYIQAQSKFNYGLISQSTLDQAKNSLSQADLNIAQLESQIDLYYVDLNNTLNVAETRTKYTLESIDTLNKLDLTEPLAKYILREVNYDVNVKIAEQELNQANISAKYLSTETTDTEEKQYDYELLTARYNYKNTKSERSILITEAYSNLQLLEQSYEKAILDLDIAKDNLRVTQLNYDAGNITNITVEQANLSVLQGELAIEQILYNYDMQLFLFKNSTLL